jgi:DNA (cytosine-5)-methyltransferase 1
MHTGILPIVNYSHASFFSGIGGFDLGFEAAGIRSVSQCELDPFCLTVLRKNYPDVPKFQDIRKLDGSVIPAADIWSGGFPCQDVSLARMGPRPGLAGKRTGLFLDFARLLKERSPRIVLLENVAGLLSSNNGTDFAVVTQTLAELGYSVGWRVLNSQHFGVPQSRQRVFIVGCYRDRDGPLQILFEPERRAGNSQKNRPHGEKPLSPFKEIIRGAGKENPVFQKIAYCLYATSARHTGTDWSRTYVSYPDQGEVRRLTPPECEGVMGFPPGWTQVDELASEADEDSARYHALGNAVTPPVVAVLARRIRCYLESVSFQAEPLAA